MTDTVAKTQCRFCLESEGEEESKDSLVDPCDCKGSAKYVHWDCLRRWVKANPPLNGHHCKVCNAAFHVNLFPPLEVIPFTGPASSSSWISSLILEHTTMTSLVIQFIYILGRARLSDEVLSDEAAWNVLLQVQAAIHLLYATCFVVEWQVKNRGVYMALVQHSRIPQLLLAHIGALYCILAYQNVWMSLATHALISQYWGEHVRVLTEMNRQFLTDR